MPKLGTIRKKFRWGRTKKGKIPQLNAYCLAEIGKYLDKNTMEACRVANRTSWNAMSAPWKAATSIRVSQTGDDKEHKDRCANYQQLENHFSEMTSHSLMELTPVANLTIIGKPAPESGSEDENQPATVDILSKDAIDFWKIHGPNLRKLTFNKVIVYDIEFFKKIIFNLTPKLEELVFLEPLVYHPLAEFVELTCMLDNPRFSIDIEQQKKFFAKTYAQKFDMSPLKYVPLEEEEQQLNLKTIQLNLHTEPSMDDINRGAWYARCLPLNWMDLFTRFPHVKNVKMWNGNIKNEELQNFFEVILNIRSVDPNALPIKSLSLNGLHQFIELPETLIEKLTAAPLPLETLNLGIRNGNASNSSTALISQLVGMHTLQALSIVRDPESDFLEDEQDIVFPKTLNKLVLDGPSFRTFSFLSATPRLRTLVVKPYTRPMIGYVPRKVLHRTKLLSLQEFVYCPSPITTIIDNPNILLPLMPNVKRLRVNMTQSLLNEISRMCTNLLHLDDMGGEYTREPVQTALEQLLMLLKLKSVRGNFLDRISSKELKILRKSISVVSSAYPAEPIPEQFHK